MRQNIESFLGVLGVRAQELKMGVSVLSAQRSTARRRRLMIQHRAGAFPISNPGTPWHHFFPPFCPWHRLFKPIQAWRLRISRASTGPRTRSLLQQQHHWRPRKRLRTVEVVRCNFPETGVNTGQSTLSRQKDCPLIYSQYPCDKCKILYPIWWEYFFRYRYSF